ncbi:zinc knuckle CX2CX4HX4C containing protein [Tanacetum coccineum]
MSEHDPDPPNPPNPPPPFDKSEFSKPHKKHDKKPDKSLKPKKTTRTMNPEPKVIMKHGKLLSSGQVNVKKVGIHSRVKESVTGIIDEGMEDGFDEEESMEAGDDATEDGLVSKEGLVDKEVKDEVGKKHGPVKGVFGNDSDTNVSAMFPELNHANLSKNSFDSGVIFDSLPEMPPPVECNLVLNPQLNVAGGIGGDLLGNVPRSGWDKNNVSGVRNGINEFGESSGGKDVEMQVNSSFKKAVSFSNVVQGTSFVGDNKLKLVPCTTNKGRKVVEMDPVIEEVDQKPLFVQRWVTGICLDKPEPARIPLWVKIYNVPLEAWNVEGISRIASRIGTPIIMDKVTTSMCERGYGRASFARVLIEVDVAEGIVDSVEIWYKKLNRTMKLIVEYAWHPPICSHCCVFGHGFKGCTSRPLIGVRIYKKSQENHQKRANTDTRTEERARAGSQSQKSKPSVNSGQKVKVNNKGRIQNHKINPSRFPKVTQIALEVLMGLKP